MRALLIDDAAKREVQRVLDYACDPANWYRPGVSKSVPGFLAEFKTVLSTYRCVFTITKFPDGNIFRHLSISVPSENYPNPFAAYTIAQLFGFTGWDEKSQEPPDSWMLNVDKNEHCIVLMQPYDRVEPSA